MADDLSAYEGCKKEAQAKGGLVTTELGCVAVYGKRVEINDKEHSIMEGFEIMNFNNHVNGTMPPLPSPEFAPGPVRGYVSPPEQQAPPPGATEGYHDA